MHHDKTKQLRMAKADIEEGRAASMQDLEIEEPERAPPNKLSLWKRFTSMDRPEASIFALRIGTALALASLFSFIAPDSDHRWPESCWIYITAGIVSWLPDTASITKKTIERISGTIAGAAIGLGLGGLSLLVGPQGSAGQRAFLGIGVSIFGFLYPYFIVRLGNVHSYAAAVGMLTFGIVALVFYDPDPSNPWKTGVFRIVNIVIGSLIASACSLIVFPLSTKEVIRSKVNGLMKSTGMATKAVFEAAADVSEGKSLPPSIWDLVKPSGGPEEDLAHKMYQSGTKGVIEIRSLFPLLRFDPLFRKMSRDKQDVWTEHMQITLGKTYRMQVAVIMLDSLLRGGLHRCDEKTDPIDILRQAGENIEQIHNRDLPSETHEAAVKALVYLDLPRIRENLSCIRTNIHNKVEGGLSGDELIAVLSTLSDQRLSALEGQGQSMLFWSIVEHLVLRAVRFHYCCLTYERDEKSYCRH